MKRVWMAGCLAILGLTYLVGCGSTDRASGGDSLLERLLQSGDMGPPAPDKMTLARQARTDGEYEVALALFREILAANPTDVLAFMGIGDVYLDQEDYTGSEPYYARAVRIEPRNYSAQSGYGKVLYLLKRFVEAVHVFHIALTIDPEGVEANLGLGATYFQMDEPEHAMVFAEKAVQAAPSNGEARANLGMVYEAIDRNDEAIDQYLFAMELLDDAEEVMVRLTSILYKEQRFQEAANTADALVKLAPSAESYSQFGRALFRLGSYDRSIESYRKAVELDASYWPAQNGIGVNALNTWIWSEKQDEQARLEARDAFRRSLQANNDQLQVIILMQKWGLL